ncbi:PEP-CTERM sorting domain-containing protein [Schlegelella sp. S2-27]|uniref:PEP-CTERM sorting domain-containing protein n=1 Tax=Caldimonas mangrovi TaxID=2944811 RepID=A0ABT0YQC7_9BURK|nr:PEP-CTERM sorting domain-containing protein [Caldimonas mangrovi]MCM5680058.1 PEP-CTERM sorting domain-containing protein [Caldimonas mangrovi]
MNDKADIIGTSMRADGTFRTSFYSDGQMIDLLGRLPAEWVVDRVAAINNSRYIAAEGFSRLTGERGALLLTPVPEPETVALLAVGLAFIALRAKRHQRKQG